MVNLELCTWLTIHIKNTLRMGEGGGGWGPEGGGQRGKKARWSLRWLISNFFLHPKAIERILVLPLENPNPNSAIFFRSFESVNRTHPLARQSCSVSFAVVVLSYCRIVVLLYCCCP